MPMSEKESLDLALQEILSDEPAASGRSSVSLGDLKNFADVAACAYVGKQVPLNETIAEQTKVAGLNEEQVRRVVEMANNNTFAKMKARGYEQNIEFDLADADAICDAVGRGEKTASAVGVRISPTRDHYTYESARNVSLDDVFNVGDYEAEQEQLTKTASAHAAVDSGFEKVATLRRQETREEQEVGALQCDMDERLTLLNEEFKKCWVESIGVEKVAHAIRSGTQTPAITESCIELVAQAYGCPDQADELYKKAMAMPAAPLNPAAPMTGLLQDLEQIGGKLMMAMQTLQVTSSSIGQLLDILRGPQPEAIGMHPAMQPPTPGDQPVPAPPPNPGV